MGIDAIEQSKPHEDYGFFGPDSVTWKVWTLPDVADDRVPALGRGRGARSER